MKIVCIIKQVPDAEARIRATAEGIDLSGVTFVIDGMDEYGVEQALRIRESGQEVEVVVLSLGPARFEEAVRTALAMGADRAVHIVAEEAPDPISQARVLAGVIEEEGADLVLVGGKEADWDSAALGPALAEALGWPQSDWTTRLELTDGGIRTVHDSDEGTETLELPLPAVVTTQQGLNEPRYPTLPNIMKAKRKELKSVPLETIVPGGGAVAKTEVVKEEIQTRERLGRLLDGAPADAARELARLLHEEAKAI